MALTRLAIARGDLEGSLELAKSIQARHPTTPVGLVLEGDIRFRDGDNQSAILAYKAAQAIESQSVVAAKIAAGHRRAGDPQAALESMISWLDKHPDDDTIRVALAAGYQSTGNMDEALEHYTRSLRGNRDNAVVLNNVAWIYFGKRDARALETAKRAYELVPQRPEIVDTYGWFLIQEGRVEKGLSLLARAVDQAPENHDIRYHWAAGLALAGDEKEARDELERLLGDEQPFTERESAEKLLKSLK